MTEEIKAFIDGMDYEDMLGHWRNAPLGHYLFEGDTGDYFAKVIAQKRKEVGQDAQVRASKAIGWDG